MFASRQNALVGMLQATLDLLIPRTRRPHSPRKNAMRRTAILIVIVAFAAAVPLLRSQNTQQPEPEIKVASQPYFPTDPNAIRVKSTMVDVTVVVRDAKGQPIAGLTQDDFQIFDEGKPQKIILFTPELAHLPVVKYVAPATIAEPLPIPPPAPPSSVPRYLGFYFDDKNMSTSELVYLRKAAEKFIHDNMEETDRAAVFTSSETVTQQFTSNKQQLLYALGKLLSHQHGRNFGTCPLITPYQAYQIGEFFNEHNDALDMAVSEALGCGACFSPGDCVRFVTSKAQAVMTINEGYAQDSLGVLGDVIRYMGKMPGKRTLIMASSGFFALSNQVQHSQDKMIDGAIHAGIIINTMDAKGLTADFGPEITGADGQQVQLQEMGFEGAQSAYASTLATMENQVSNDPLAAIAEGTGGKFFHDNNDMNTGLRELAEAPAASYVLGFSPGEAKDNGAFHNLKVKLPSHHDIHIEARPGYFELTKQEALPGVKFQKLNKEVMSADTLTEIQTEVTTNSGTLATGEPALKVTVHVPGRSLYFKKINKLHNERVIFITALFDKQNHFLAGTEAVMDMNLKDATFTKLSHDGVDAKSTLQAPSGTYRLRQVVQEVVGGRISTSTHEVQIR
jgi:VWFA-related protein